MTRKRENVYDFRCFKLILCQNQKVKMCNKKLNKVWNRFKSFLNLWSFCFMFVAMNLPWLCRDIYVSHNLNAVSSFNDHDMFMSNKSKDQLQQLFGDLNFLVFLKWCFGTIIPPWLPISRRKKYIYIPKIERFVL